MLKDILEEYESNSEQCINFEKSTVFFSANTEDDMCERIIGNLRVRLSIIRNTILAYLIWWVDEKSFISSS